MDPAIVPMTQSPPPDPAILPGEWAAWSEEPGLAVRLEEDGVLLGAVYAVMVGPTEGWLEGLWVRPAARGRGVARRLIAEAEGVLGHHGARVVRTAVPARDYAAMTVAEHTGFARTLEAHVRVAEMPAGPLDRPYEAPVRPATMRDVPAILRRIDESPDLRAWHGLVPLGWRFRRAVTELVQGLVKDRRALVTGEEAEGACLFAVHDGDLVISVLAGAPAHRQALIAEVADRGRAAGAARLVLFAPEAEPGVAVRSPWRPHAWCPDGLVVVEKTLGPR